MRLTLREQGVGCIWVLGQRELQREEGITAAHGGTGRKGERRLLWRDEKQRWSRGLWAQYATDREADSFFSCFQTLPSQNKNTHALYLRSLLTPACWSSPPPSLPAFSHTIHSAQPILVDRSQPMRGQRRNSRPFEHTHTIHTHTEEWERQSNEETEWE